MRCGAWHRCMQHAGLCPMGDGRQSNDKQGTHAAHAASPGQKMQRHAHARLAAWGLAARACRSAVRRLCPLPPGLGLWPQRPQSMQLANAALTGVVRLLKAMRTQGVWRGQQGSRERLEMEGPGSYTHKRGRAREGGGHWRVCIGTGTGTGTARQGASIAHEETAATAGRLTPTRQGEDTVLLSPRVIGEAAPAARGRPLPHASQCPHAHRPRIAVPPRTRPPPTPLPLRPPAPAAARHPPAAAPGMAPGPSPGRAPGRAPPPRRAWPPAGVLPSTARRPPQPATPAAGRPRPGPPQPAGRVRGRGGSGVFTWGGRGRGQHSRRACSCVQAQKVWQARGGRPHPHTLLVPRASLSSALSIPSEQ